MSQEGFNEYLEKHQYKVILEDVTNIEDTEKIMRMVGGAADEDDSATEDTELSAEDLLNQAVAANATEAIEEVEEDQTVDSAFDDFLDDEENND